MPFLGNRKRRRPNNSSNNSNNTQSSTNTSSCKSNQKEEHQAKEAQLVQGGRGQVQVKVVIASNDPATNSTTNGNHPQSQSQSQSQMAQHGGGGGGEEEFILSQVWEEEEESLLDDWSYNGTSSELDGDGDDCCDDGCDVEEEEEEDAGNDGMMLMMDRIQERFRRRGRTFGRITAHKSQSYRNALLAKECSSREHTLRSYVDVISGTATATTTGTTSTISSPATTTTPKARQHDSLACMLQQLRYELLLEGHHSLEAVGIAIGWCWGNISLYTVVEYCAKMVLTKMTASTATGTGAANAYYFTLILLGVALMRCNGYLWEWLSLKSHRLVKFEMHNRRRLGYWDAKILSWLKQQQKQQQQQKERDKKSSKVICYYRWNSYVSMTAFYLLYLGVAHFYQEAWTAWEAWIYHHYTQLEKVWIEHMHEAQIPFGTCTALLAIPTLPVWQRWGANVLCEEMVEGSGMPLTSLIFNGLMLVVSATALARMGGSLFEM